jgi:hypothetical protein
MTKTQARAANDNDRLEDTTLESFSRTLSTRLGADASFAEREAAGLALANELCRADLERDLERRAAHWRCDEIEVNGTRYRRHSVDAGTGTYHGLCGSLVVERWLYRQVGVHNGPTVVPLELDAGLMEGATPALAFAVAQGYAQAPSRQVHATMEAHHRVAPSRSTTERIAKALGTRMAEALPRIEPVVREKEVLPEGARGISIGLDRTSAPMEEPLEGEAKRKSRKKPYVRAKPDPIQVNYRMAYVGTVSIVDAEGGAIVTRRYGATAEDGPEGIVARMMADVNHARSAGTRLRTSVVQDGAPEMWNLVSDGLRKLANVRRWTEAIDRHHVLERLAKVLAICKFTEAWRAEKLAEWNDRLDCDDGAIDEIRAYVRELYETHRGDARRALEKHDTYFDNNHERMRYASMRAAGLPVASGPTEGACKSLVMTRAKRCGQRWHVTGLRSVLALRALDMSERLRPTFDLLAHDYTASLKVAA